MFVKKNFLFVLLLFTSFLLLVAALPVLANFDRADLFARKMSHTVNVSSQLFTPDEKDCLVELIKRNSKAKAEFKKLKKGSDKSLKRKPHPIKEIEVEGELTGSRAKKASIKALADMKILHALGYVYAVSGEAKYAAKAQEYILAWVKINKVSGNPINETSLESLIVAYDLTREIFSVKERNVVDDYLRELIKEEWKAEEKVNNWQSHRLKLVGLAAYVLNDEELIEKAIQGFFKHVNKNLKPDGSSYDFHRRDALHYHIYDLIPLLTLAIVADKHGVNLYDYTSKSGASLRKSVDFLLPYCLGEKTHKEFKNSLVSFDRKRAVNGEDSYKKGSLFKPEKGVKVLALAAYFDESINPLIAKITNKSQKSFSSWRMVLNEVKSTP